MWRHSLSKSCSWFLRPASSSRQLHTSPHSSLAMELSSVVKQLEGIAPTAAAEPWDNVGLLVEPSSPQPIRKILVTNDLTEEVLVEATRTSQAGVRTGLIVSYHPPIFKPLKRLTQNSSKERIIVSVVEQGVGVYSPHTALDNMPEGINDWLLSAVGEGEVTALGVQKHSSFSNVLEVKGLVEECNAVDKLLKQTSGADTVQSSPNQVLAECTDKALASIWPKMKEFTNLTVTASSNPKFYPTLSGGKMLTLQQPAPLMEIVKRVKSRLKLEHLRLAKPSNLEEEDLVVSTAAVCAGSGGSVLQGVKADLLLTGEMSHHQVLDATSRGAAVILCEHSNTERGYLQGIYKNKLEKALQGLVEVAVSSVDRDPLQIV